MERLCVVSATLAAVGYDPANRVLELEFHRGVIYCYGDVPVELYRQLLSAESKGRFFNRHIRNHFLGIRLPNVRPTTKTI